MIYCLCYPNTQISDEMFTFYAFIWTNTLHIFVNRIYKYTHKIRRGFECAIRQDQTIKCLQKKWRQTSWDRYTQMYYIVSYRNHKLGSTSSVDKIAFVAQEISTELTYLLFNWEINVYALMGCTNANRTGTRESCTGLYQWAAGVLVRLLGTAFDERQALNMVQRQAVMRSENVREED